MQKKKFGYFIVKFKKFTWNWVMFGLRHLLAAISSTFITWMEWARALCLAPISRYNWVTARAVVKSLYSRYMLWVPLLESYLNQMAKFLIFVGFLSNTYKIFNKTLNSIKFKLSIFFECILQTFDVHALKNVLFTKANNYFITCDNFTMCFLDILQKSDKIPKSTLGNNRVCCKDSHL